MGKRHRLWLYHHNHQAKKKPQQLHFFGRKQLAGPGRKMIRLWRIQLNSSSVAEKPFIAPHLLPPLIIFHPSFNQTLYSFFHPISQRSLGLLLTGLIVALTAMPAKRQQKRPGICRT